MEKQLNHEQLERRQRDCYPIILLADHIDDPINIGSLFRLADAAGVEKVIFVSDKPPLKFKKIDKVARSTRKIIPHQFCRSDEIDKILPVMYQKIVLELTNESKIFTEFVTDKPLILILGNESKGVSQEIIDKSDQSIHIPMMGQNSSMNVSMAAGIVVYHLISNLKPINSG